MATQNGSAFSEMMEQAMGAYTGALKATVKLQEDATKFWTGAAKANPMAATYEDFQKRSQALWAEAGPAGQKQMDEYLQMFDSSYAASLELMKKAMVTGRPESMADAQEKITKLVDETMELVRTNAKAMAETNIRVFQEWSDSIRKGVQSATEAAAAAQTKANEALRAASSAT